MESIFVPCVGFLLFFIYEILFEIPTTWVYFDHLDCFYNLSSFCQAIG